MRLTTIAFCIGTILWQLLSPTPPPPPSQSSSICGLHIKLNRFNLWNICRCSNKYCTRQFSYCIEDHRRKRKVKLFDPNSWWEIVQDCGALKSNPPKIEDLKWHNTDVEQWLWYCPFYVISFCIFFCFKLLFRPLFHQSAHKSCRLMWLMWFWFWSWCR